MRYDGSVISECTVQGSSLHLPVMVNPGNVYRGEQASRASTESTFMKTLPYHLLYLMLTLVVALAELLVILTILSWPTEISLTFMLKLLKHYLDLSGLIPGSTFLKTSRTMMDWNIITVLEQTLLFSSLLVLTRRSFSVF